MRRKTVACLLADVKDLERPAIKWIQRRRIEDHLPAQGMIIYRRNDFFNRV